MARKQKVDPTVRIGIIGGFLISWMLVLLLVGGVDRLVGGIEPDDHYGSQFYLLGCMFVAGPLFSFIGLVFVNYRRLRRTRRAAEADAARRMAHMMAAQANGAGPTRPVDQWTIGRQRPVPNAEYERRRRVEEMLRSRKTSDPTINIDITDLPPEK